MLLFIHCWNKFLCIIGAHFYTLSKHISIHYCWLQVMRHHWLLSISWWPCTCRYGCAMNFLSRFDWNFLCLVWIGGLQEMKSYQRMQAGFLCAWFWFFMHLLDMMYNEELPTFCLLILYSYTYVHKFLLVYHTRPCARRLSNQRYSAGLKAFFYLKTR